MPCDDSNHVHEWPDSGFLNIEKCERYCGYCHGPRRSKAQPNATILRKHAMIHVKPGAEFENVIVVRGKGGRPVGHKPKKRRIQEDGLARLHAFELESKPQSRLNDWPTARRSMPRQESEDQEEEDSLGSYRKALLPSHLRMMTLTRSSESPSPEPEAAAARTMISRSHERGAKRRAQEQIKTSYALPVEYVPSPSPEPMDEDEGDEGIVYSEDEISGPQYRAPTQRSMGSLNQMSSGGIPHDRESHLMRDAVPATRLAPRPASQSARKPTVSDRSRTSSMPRISRASQALAPRSSTPEPESEDDERESPPQPSLEALTRIRQHIERREREMKAPRHPKSGKRPVLPTKDFSKLWLKEFEPES